MYWIWIEFVRKISVRIIYIIILFNGEAIKDKFDITYRGSKLGQNSGIGNWNATLFLVRSSDGMSIGY